MRITARYSERTKCGRGTSRASLLCAVAAIVVVLVAPAPSQAAKVEFGLQAEREGDQTLSEVELARMREGGVRVVRTPFGWELAQRSPGQALDFTNFDNLMLWASQGDLPPVEVLPILVGSPEWVRGSDLNNEPPTHPTDVRRWQDYVTALVNRYGRGGKFWAEHPELQPNPIRAWQVWNEPNHRAFWTNGKPNPRDYAAFLNATDNAIRKGRDRSAKTVLAGMPERHRLPRSAAGFLERAYKVKGFARDFDVATIHPYAKNAGEVRAALRRVRDLLKDNGDKRKPLWLTEVGFASTGPNSPYTKSARGQASLLEDTFQAIERSGRAERVERAIWFKWRDSDTDPPHVPANHRWQTYTGLFTKNGNPKRAWSAFTDFVGGDPGSGSLP